MVLALLGFTFAQSVEAQIITNLQQLTTALSSEERIFRNVRLEVVVCAASRPEIGVLIVEDSSGVELLEVGRFRDALRPGERLLIEGYHSLLRRRPMGIELAAGPLVDNDGIHIHRTWLGRVPLKEGLHPIRLEWFNNLRESNLEVSFGISNRPPQAVDPADLWHAIVDESGRTNYAPGLRVEHFEGYWESMPNFDLLVPVKTEIVPDFSLDFTTRDEMTGMRFSGFFKALEDGQYSFTVRSDDGSLLYIGDPRLPIVRLGTAEVPKAKRAFPEEPMESLTHRKWATIEGRVGFVSQQARGLVFELRSDRDVILAQVADAEGLDVSKLRNAEVRVTGVARGVMTRDQRTLLGRVFVVDSGHIEIGRTPNRRHPPSVITSVGAVQSLPLDVARRAIPVRVRGVVTEIRTSFFERRISLQDDTRGIFVQIPALTNVPPSFGDLIEVEGHSEAGDFAPIIVASKVVVLGGGCLPEPVRPTWNELLTGRMDVQWAELHGLVTAVQSNTVTLLLPEGRLDVQMDDYYESQLAPFQSSVARIRGVLYAVWNPDSREVTVGTVLMRNAAIAVDASAPDDLFDAASKTPRDLLLFDAQATPFRRVKVRGVVVHAAGSQAWLQEDGVGIRLLLAERTYLRPGDIVEAVGYPDIGRTALLLREAVLRKTGEGPLPKPRLLAETELPAEGLDSIRVRIEGKLLGWHTEQGSPVLEMQSGSSLYHARFAPRAGTELSLRPGSRLSLDGVYAGRGRNLGAGHESDSFALMLNSARDVVVLSQPPWWTLPRLLAVVGVLLVTLAFTAIWIKQLRRLVEQRTTQLQHQIRERERIEHRHALEAERSRIARDLHDDLGSSLTEISALASTGLRREEKALEALGGEARRGEEANPASLFQTISGKARNLVAALDVIVWAVDPEDNSLQSLADYLSGYAAEFFSHTNISCRFRVPVQFPDVRIEGRVRHDLLMAVKESLNNIVRHAEATEVEFCLSIAEGNLEVDIRDNGRGINGFAGRDGHGLKNLCSRLKELGGLCDVKSREGGGTAVTLRLPLGASTGSIPPAG